LVRRLTRCDIAERCNLAILTWQLNSYSGLLIMLYPGSGCFNSLLSKQDKIISYHGLALLFSYVFLWSLLGLAPSITA